MRPDRVVVLPPRLDEAPRLVKGSKPMFVQAFIAQSTVEALDVGVLHRLARLDEVQLDATAVRPGIQGAARKLWAIIDGEGLGQPVGLGQAVQNLDDLGAGQRRVDCNRRRFP